MKEVLIFGSCATRDAFEIVPNDFQIGGYIARSSFASAFHPKRFPLSIQEVDPDFKISSDWQRRMIELDLNKKAGQLISNKATAASLVIVDFIDERFDLFELDSAVATASVALKSVFGAGQRKIISGSEEHQELWLQGFSRFVDLTTKLELKLIVNAVLVSGETQEGEIFDMKLVKRHNESLMKLYDIAASFSACEIIFNPEKPLCDPLHKWGPAPFHYQKSYYEKFINTIISR